MLPDRQAHPLQEIGEVKADENCSSVNEIDPYDGTIETDMQFPLISLDDRRKMNPEETLVHLIKSNIGAGVLTLPFAFRQGGILFSSIVFWIVGAISLYCMHILIRVYHYHRPLVQREKLDYGDLIRFSFECHSILCKFAKFGKFVIDFFLISSQLGFCCVYFVFVPLHVKEVVHFYWPGDPSVYVYVFVMFLFVSALSLIRSLKLLSPVSLIANLLSITSLVLVLQYIVRDSVPLSTLPLVAPLSEWVFFLSTCVYAFEGIGFVLPLMHKMANPTAYVGWSGVLNTGMFLCAILFFTVGFYGVLRFGVDVKGSIALNLPNNQPLYQFTKLIFALAVFLTYPLQFYVPATILWPRIKRRFLYRLNDTSASYAEYIWRTVVVFCTATFALIVPDIGLVVSLIGSFACTALALIFPPILDIINFAPHDFGKFYHRLVLDVFILCFGLCVFFLGTYMSASRAFNCLIYKQCNN